MFTTRNKDHFVISKIHANILIKEFTSAKTLKLDKIRELYQPISINNIEIPKEINAEVRNYQKTGYAWLKRLKENDFGGCLADDMGLGKTLQFLCFIQDTIANDLVLRERKELQAGKQLTIVDMFEVPQEELAEGLDFLPSLIVVPTSLVHNWVNEILKFAPSLRFLKYTGAERGDLLPYLSNYDVVITTYGVIRNDIDMLKRKSFHVLAIDEAQYIKNPQSKSYKAILELNSRYKVALSGTPIENSLSDLWAQMNFLNRGILGTFSYFKKEYQTPIEKHANKPLQEKLIQIVTPFILRRTKQEVAKDLPELTETTVNCVMSDEQAKKYDELKSKIRNTIIDDYIKPDERKNRTIHILKGLMQLRLFANHPKMMDSESLIESGKFDEVKEYVERIMIQNNKVLIFSSFVRHLTLFAEFFKSQNWKYTMLTGQTSNREGAVSAFQHDDNCKLFLVSLKAGGVGLNLTAADYVFILDPWWNMAAEKQAINRAHRIGRENKVMVYRFITENTIEQKIQNLQHRKDLLSDTFVNSKNILKYLNDEQVKEMFE